MKKTLKTKNGRDRPPETPKKKDSMFGADKWLRKSSKKDIRDETD